MRYGWLVVLTVMIPTVTTPTTPPAPQQGFPTGRGGGAVSPEWPALQRSMRKMHETMMLVEPSLSGDADFVSLMIPHHQAAIDMAKTELLNGADPQIRRLAQEIVTEQQSEIELMELWKKENRSRTK